ncbi:MAG: hypothetical protein JEZ06_17115 [Anaerolineaceae bacterium]|nr:hypothetical protein [Anaerolineaceae bacterium]
MEFEQIIQRLEWLDDERRKDKNLIALLQEKVEHLEGNSSTLANQNKELTSEVSHISAVLSRFDQIEERLSKLKVEYGRQFEEIEKTRIDQNREAEKTRRKEVEQINQSIGEIRKLQIPLSELEKQNGLRVEEEFRLGTLVDEMRNKLLESGRVDEEYQRTVRLMEESRRQDAKRVNDLQSEVSALRKRSDEQRGKLDLANESNRKLELRINELQSSEAERKQSQSNFIEHQNVIDLDREKIWKDWDMRFNEILDQSTNVDSQLLALESTQRSLKRSQDSFEEITQRFDRRVNELTEMQRLAEERFRQEWATFKADDQKRWSNYTLAEEENLREIDKQFDKVGQRLGSLEDLTQEVNDMVTHLSGEIQKRLHLVLQMTNDWLEDFDQIPGSLG